MRLNDSNEWFVTDFANFEPNENIEDRYLRVIFRSIRNHAPGDSVFKFRVDQRGELYRGILEVKSSQKNFVCTAYDKEIYSLADKLKKDLSWQIESWKQSHYFNMAI